MQVAEYGARRHMWVRWREESCVDRRDDIYVVARGYIPGDTLQLARGQRHRDISLGDGQISIGAALNLVGIGGNHVGCKRLALVYRHQGGVTLQVLQADKRVWRQRRRG